MEWNSTASMRFGEVWFFLGVVNYVPEWCGRQNNEGVESITVREIRRIQGWPFATIKQLLLDPQPYADAIKGDRYNPQ